MRLISLSMQAVLRCFETLMVTWYIRMAYCANTFHLLLGADRQTNTNFTLLRGRGHHRPKSLTGLLWSYIGPLLASLVSGYSREQNHMIDRGLYEAIERLTYL